ncbi:MAG TPA: ATP-binding protein [Oligoflexus sp.]|uniref:ATP-binding protein n=1 Tax=Oligoflexus sp. TaxID=1971216 RepID=UPI002D6A78BE|nr:ATP-binding protein [Oligoflexus sp.]HYX35625.1 ATP-binding protein [Oligoflexus sp.]
MHIFIIKILLIPILAVCFACKSAAADTVVDLAALEESALDEPAATIRSAELYLADIDPSKDSEKWMRIYSIMLDAKYSRGETDSLQPMIEQLLNTARREGNAKETVLALVLKAKSLHENSDRKTVMGLYEESLSLCNRSPERGLCAIPMSSLAYYNYFIEDYPKALENIQKSLAIIDKNDVKQVNQWYLALNVMAIILDNLGDFDKSIPLYEQVYAHAVQRKWRFFSSVLAYNLGKAYLLNGTKAPLKKSLQYFEESADLAVSIDDELSVGWAQMGIGEYYGKAQKHDLALQPLQKAQQIFVKFGMKRQSGECWILIAHAHFHLGNMTASEQAIAHGNSLIPVEFQAESANLKRLSYDIEKRKGKLQTALVFLEEYLRLSEAQSRTERENQLNKLRVLLGLDAAEMRSALLKREVEIKQRLLVNSEKIKILFQALFLLSIFTVASAGFVVFQMKKHHNRRLWMEQVMNAMEEGIITINRNLTVKHGQSRQAAAALGYTDIPIEGLDIISMVFDRTQDSSDQKAIYRESLAACFGPDDIGWELNQHHLPREIIQTDDVRKVLSIHWQPLLSAQGSLDEIILVIRDITQSRHSELELARKRAQQDKVHSLLTEITSIKAGRALAFLRSFDLNLTRVHDAALNTKDPYPCLRELHTMKGEARTLGLQTLADSIHSVETTVLGVHNETRTQTEGERDWEDLLLVRSELMEIVKALQTDTATYQFSNLLEISAELNKEAQRELGKHEFPFDGIEVRDSFQNWTPGILKLVHQSLIHALSNSIDHGYIRPRSRGQTPRHAKFEIVAQREGHDLIVAFSDNGAGFEFQKLRALAEARQFTPSPQETIADVLFLEGVSTAEAVSQTSGRGVGLAAIKNLWIEAGGLVQLRVRESGGTALTMRLPCDPVEKPFAAPQLEAEGA